MGTDDQRQPQCHFPEYQRTVLGLMHPFQKQDCSVHPIPENLPQSSQLPESAPVAPKAAPFPWETWASVIPHMFLLDWGHTHRLRKVATMLCLDSSKEGRGFGSFYWVALPFLTTAPAKKSVSASCKAPRPVAHRICKRTGVDCSVCSEVWGCWAHEEVNPFITCPLFTSLWPSSGWELHNRWWE